MARLTVLLVAAIAGTGCGGGEERPTSPAADARSVAASEEAELEGCTLVTQDEVSAALGSPAGDGEEAGLLGCRWKAESGAVASVVIYAGSSLVASTCDAQRFLVSGRQEDVAGLGDSALWGTSGDLVVCSSKAVLKVDVDNTPNSPDQDREAAIALAKAALGRL